MCRRIYIYKTIVDSKQTFEGWLTDVMDNRDLRSDQADECKDLPIREDNARHSEENLLANWSKRKRTKISFSDLGDVVRVK